jgi:geranylgeranyl diphosphate synthase, type I
MNETLSRIFGDVERRLERLFESQEDGGPDAIFVGRPAPLLLDCVRDLTLRGGKRLRAALVHGGACLFDPAALGDPAVRDAAAAMELLHTYFLIHDDIMDEDETRRGGPSAHAALGAAVGDAKKGRDLAILAGDLASALHEGLVAGLDAPEGRRRTAARLFARMHADVIHGQTLDLLGGAVPEDVADHKTASYTTVGPVAIGAALGGATWDGVVRVAAIARPIGIAFQISDDLLGAFGDPAATGKPRGSDLRSGKRTALLQIALERADAAQRAAIEAVLGERDADGAAVEAAISAIAMTGAKAACEERAAALVSGAVRAIEGSGCLAEGIGMIAHIARLAVFRER